MRMRLRDVLSEEVIQGIDASPSKHRHRRDGRWEVVERVGRKYLKIVYLRRAEGMLVINVMWE
jgi:hypothetical protein